MSTMLIAQNETRESGSFMGDQLCSLKAAYLFVENQPDVDRVIMSVSPKNEMHFLWTKFIERYNVELVRDDWDAGDWTSRWNAWDRWRTERRITLNDGSVVAFDHYRELYLQIHGLQRQTVLCGSERGLGRRNIYEYWLAGQENAPDVFPGADWFDDTLIHHPPRRPARDVWISPHAKTQGNFIFTFDFWSDVIHRLVDEGVTVTVGFNGLFCHDLVDHPCYRQHWGTHEEWMQQVCAHRIVACGNTGTGWLAAACGVPMITMEPHYSIMQDHRYRECGLRNLVEVVDGDMLDAHGNDMVRVADYVARRIMDQVKRCVVLTTGCYDVLHAGHVRHLQRARSLGTKLVVALNSDSSVRSLKGETRPVNPQDQRKAVLEALRCVDEVRLFDGPDATALIRELRPDVLACGMGYTSDRVLGRDIVESYGGRVEITYQGDASDEPSTTKILARSNGMARAASLHRAVRAAAPYSVNPAEKLKLLATEFVKVADLPGDVADLGSCQGGTALVLRRLAPEKHLHLFDTWTGTPEDDPLCHHRRGEWAASLEACRALVGRDERTYYHEGFFPHTAERALGNWRHHRGEEPWPFCFVYVDMDTYQSTRDACAFFFPRLVPGGVMMFDDYGWAPCAGVQKAVDEAFTDAQVGYDKRVVESLWACIVQKE